MPFLNRCLGTHRQKHFFIKETPMFIYFQPNPKPLYATRPLWASNYMKNQRCEGKNQSKCGKSQYEVGLCLSCGCPSAQQEALIEHLLIAKPDASSSWSLPDCRWESRVINSSHIKINGFSINRSTFQLHVHAHSRIHWCNIDCLRAEPRDLCWFLWVQSSHSSRDRHTGQLQWVWKMEEFREGCT